jgi:hypothetical protein
LSIVGISDTDDLSAVESVYASEERYLYELIQNADDAFYAGATERGEMPSLTFTLTDEYLYIDTNEDGFKFKNVRAICGARESSKHASGEGQSIGEKGIGFKAVYTIAENVHIQSGVWSFRFNHVSDVPLSIFIPVPVEPSKLPDGVVTRIALRYYDGYTDRIVKALREVSHDVVMFLHKLTRLKMQFESTNALATASFTQSFERQPRDVEKNGDIVVLSVDSSSEAHPIVKTYRIYKRQVSDMPEEATRNKSIAEVQLAFPVNSYADKPCISPCGEWIFAYLPMLRDPQLPVSCMISIQDYI